MARITRIVCPLGHVPEIHDEQGLQAGASEELRVDARLVETAHWPGIEADRPRGDDEVARLEGRVEQCSLGSGGIVGELVLRVRYLRQDAGEMFVKIGVGGEDGDDRCGEGLGAIALMRSGWEFIAVGPKRMRP